MRDTLCLQKCCTLRCPARRRSTSISSANSEYKPQHRAQSIEWRVTKPARSIAHIYCLYFRDGSIYVGQTAQSLSERLAEHLAKPTNAAVAAVIGPDTRISLLAEIAYETNAQLLSTEADFIARALAAGDKVLNDKHNHKHAERVAPTMHVPSSVAISIGTDVSKRRYEVRLQRKNVEAHHQVRRFVWGDDQAAALKRAEEWRAFLLFHYF